MEPLDKLAALMFMHGIDSAYDAVQQELLAAQKRITELETELQNLCTEYQHVLVEHCPLVMGHAKALRNAIAVLEHKEVGR